MSDEPDEIGDAADSAAAAFEALRAEVSVLRRAVEDIPASLHDNRSPDYAPGMPRGGGEDRQGAEVRGCRDGAGTVAASAASARQAGKKLL